MDYTFFVEIDRIQYYFDVHTHLHVMKACTFIFYLFIYLLFI